MVTKFGVVQPPVVDNPQAEGVVFPKLTANEVLPAEQIVEVVGVNVYE
jgi:hypothetical protein